MRTSKPFVAHDCKNPKCNRRWLDEDDTGVTSRPPRNKYCPDCEVFGGFTSKKDPKRVMRGKMLAAQRRAQQAEAARKELEDWI